MNMPEGKSMSRTILATSLLVGLCAGLPAAADDTGSANASCREEIRRVVVWPTGGNPKSAQSGRTEDRAVTVCNGKVVFEPHRNTSTARR